MKKLVSILVLTAMLMTFAVMAVSAANISPEGTVTVSVPEDTKDSAVFVDKDGNEKTVDITKFEVTKSDGTKEVVNLVNYIRVVKVKKIVALAGNVIKAEKEPISADWAKKVSSEGALKTIFGDKYDSYKLYQLFQIELIQEGKELIGDFVLKSLKVKVEIEGLANVNAATIFHHDEKSDAFTIVDAAFNDNKADMCAEFDSDGIGRYGIMYAPTATSPSTNVSSYVIFGVVAIFALAVVGAVYTAKKAFSKK